MGVVVALPLPDPSDDRRRAKRRANGQGSLYQRKDGRWVYYHLSEKGATKNVRGALKWLRSSFSDDAHSSIDMKTLEKVVAKDREALCRSQSKK